MPEIIVYKVLTVLGSSFSGMQDLFPIREDKGNKQKHTSQILFFLPGILIYLHLLFFKCHQMHKALYVAVKNWLFPYPLKDSKGTFEAFAMVCE